MSLIAGDSLLAVLCPCLMALAVQRSGNRAYRIGIYFVGVMAAISYILRLGHRTAERKIITDTNDSFIAVFANFLLVANLSLVGTYAFSNDIYRPHPLPCQPKYYRIRGTTWFRYLDTFLSMDRKINYPPNPPLKSLPRPSGRAQCIRRAIIWSAIYSLLVDFFTMWLPLLRDQGVYLPDGSRDIAKFCEILASRYRLPVLAVRGDWMVCYVGTVFCGIQGGWEVIRGLGIGSGIWIEEEWPELMQRPYLSTSMIELWGRRYHQLLRSTFHTILSPFHPRESIYIFSAFILSGLYHVLIMYPLHGHFPLHYLPFFISCGMVCLFERTIYRLTGYKVRGVWGWIWTWTWIYVLGWRSLEADINAGQLEGFRAPVSVFGYSGYPLDHVVSYIRWREGHVEL